MSRSKAARLGREVAVDPLAARALGRDRDLVEPAAVRRRPVAPDADDVAARRSRSRAAPGPIGSGAGAPKNGDLDPAAGDVAVADEPDVLAALAARPRSSRRASRSVTIRTPSAAAGPLEPAPGAPGRRSSPSARRRAGRRRGRRGTRPAARSGRSGAPTKIDRAVAGERGLDVLGGLDDEPVLEARAKSRPGARRTRGSSGRRGGTPTGRGARAPAGRVAAARTSGRRRGRCRRASATTRRRLRRAGRRARARAGTQRRRRGPRARRAARSGSWQASHDAAPGHAPGAAGPACLEGDEPRRRSRLRGPQATVDGGRVGRGIGAGRRPATSARVDAGERGRSAASRRGPVVGEHRGGPCLELGGLRLGRGPHRLEAVPLLGRRGDRSPRARRRSPGSPAGCRPATLDATVIDRRVRRRGSDAVGRRAGSRPAGSPSRSSRRASPGRPAASSTRRTGGPGCRRSGSPSR